MCIISLTHNYSFYNVCGFIQNHCSPCVLGLVKYDVSVRGASSAALKVTLMDKDGHCVTSSTQSSGVLKVVDVRLWWPYLMHANPGYLYSLEVRTCLHTQSQWLLWVSLSGHRSIVSVVIKEAGELNQPTPQ